MTSKFCAILATSAILFASCKKSEVPNALTTSDAANSFTGSTTIAAGPALNYTTGISAKPGDYICVYGAKSYIVFSKENALSYFPKTEDVPKIDFVCTMKLNPYVYLTSPAACKTMFSHLHESILKNTLFYKISASNIDETKLHSTSMSTLNYIKSLIAISKDKGTEALAGNMVKSYYVFVTNSNLDPIYQKYGLIRTFNSINNNGIVLLDIWTQAY